MKKTSVLITTYQSAFLHPGGGEAELKNLVEVLRQIGIDADIYGSMSRRIEAYDVVLHFSVHGESYDFVRTIKKMGKRLILWPNLWWNEPPSRNELESFEMFLNISDIVIFKSKSEVKNIEKYASLENIIYKIVPWHIDKQYIESAPVGLFQKIYGLSDYILWVGSIEPVKNQLQVIETLHDCPVPLVFIGGYRDKSYFEQCRLKASKDTIFVPFMDQGSDILRSAYHGCSVYLELSTDPAGLSALEAALYEKPMVLSRNDWAEEEFGDSISLVDISNKQEIRNAVSEAIQGMHKYKSKQKIIKNHLNPESLEPLVSVMQSTEI